MKTVYNGRSYRVATNDAHAGAAVICFAPRVDHPTERFEDPEDNWGLRFIDSCDARCFVVTPKENDWYQGFEIGAVAQRIKSLIEQPPILYGCSMGGYAAHALSGFFGAKSWIAISPQHDAAPCDVDSRWLWERLEATAPERRMKTLAAPVQNGIVYCDPAQSEDAYSAHKIVSGGGVQLRSVHGAGHSVMGKITQNEVMMGTLKDTVREVVADRPDIAA